MIQDLQQRTGEDAKDRAAKFGVKFLRNKDVRL